MLETPPSVEPRLFVAHSTFEEPVPPSVAIGVVVGLAQFVLSVNPFGSTTSNAIFSGLKHSNKMFDDCE